MLNQLFGKGKEPFWQQAYTNLVRWIIELYRVLPPPDGSDTPGWVTLRDVYHCAIDKALFAKKIEQAQTYATADMGDEWITVAAADAHFLDHVTASCAPSDFTHAPGRPGTDARAPATPAAIDVPHRPTRSRTTRERSESALPRPRSRLRVEAVNRWYVHDWNTLDNKIRSSIVEGVSVFLSMFDLPRCRARVLPARARRARASPGAAG